MKTQNENEQKKIKISKITLKDLNLDEENISINKIAKREIENQNENEIKLEKYKGNKERLKKEISRIENLNLDSRGTKKYLKELNKSLEQSFEDYKRQEEDRQNIIGVKL